MKRSGRHRAVSALTAWTIRSSLPLTMTNHSFKTLTPDLSGYTMDELIAVSNMIERVGEALEDAFTVNSDVRPFCTDR